jgi:hypothetical protein
MTKNQKWKLHSEMNERNESRKTSLTITRFFCGARLWTGRWDVYPRANRRNVQATAAELGRGRLCFLDVRSMKG